MISKEIEKGINHLKKNDEYLARIISLSEKCKLSRRKNYYLAFLRSIIGQQLSVLAAAAIYRRFLTFFDENPLPEKIIITPDEQLRGLGLSWAKVKYVKDFSSKILNNEIHFRNLNRMTDEEIIADFTRVKGIGVWTVHMFLIFTLSRLNVLPLNDLGLKRGAMIVYNFRKIPDEKKIAFLSKKFGWTPYNSIASWYLWKSLEMRDLLKKQLLLISKKV